MSTLGTTARRGWWRPALLAPALVALGIFFVLPVALIIWTAFTDPAPGLHHFAAVLTEPSTRAIITRTLVMALVTATVTLVLAYPYAYLMTVVGPRWRAVLTALVLLPFWTSLMARTFAWIIILQPNGPLVRLTSLVGFDEPLLQSAAGVTIGMVQVLLPYMVLPLYATMSSIDRRLLSAAASLGARPSRAFRRVYLPLSMPGVVAGYTLVFILALGFYVTPKLLGSPRESMLAQLIGTRVEKLLDFAGAGALSVVMLLITGLLLLLVSRVARVSAMLGMGEDRNA